MQESCTACPGNPGLLRPGQGHSRPWLSGEKPTAGVKVVLGGEYDSIEHEACIRKLCGIQIVYAGEGMERRRKGIWRVNEGYVNTVLRKDGTVVTITPTGSNYDLAIDGEHRTIGPEMASDPLNDPAFETIVQELKKDLERQCQPVSPAHEPAERH